MIWDAVNRKGACRNYEVTFLLESMAMGHS